MSNSNTKKPVVLTIAGHDPSGGAGIQADIESISCAGCYPVSIITALTTQNTSQVEEIIPQTISSFQKQLQLILKDFDVRACKLGIFASLELIEIASQQLIDQAFPIVLDPVIRSGAGDLFSNEEVCNKLMSHLFPLSTVVTPNSEEARQLSDKEDLISAAEILLNTGAENVLITGTHEKTDNVINTLYTKDMSTYEYQWDRLTGEFHGSGCTLSSQIAAQLALGHDIVDAIKTAQTFTWHTLKNGLKLGQGQLLPNRFFGHQ